MPRFEGNQDRKEGNLPQKDPPDYRKEAMPEELGETLTNNEYIRGMKNSGSKRFDRKLYQMDIVRKDGSNLRIARYIEQNPAKWSNDRFYSA